MSRFTVPTIRANVASKITFDALEVELGEDTDEEEVPSGSDKDVNQSLPHESPKPSKSAIKKAQKLARIEARQRQKQLKAEAKEFNSPQPPNNAVLATDVSAPSPFSSVSSGPSQQHQSKPVSTSELQASTETTRYQDDELKRPEHTLETPAQSSPSSQNDSLEVLKPPVTLPTEDIRVKDKVTSPVQPCTKIPVVANGRHLETKEGPLQDAEKVKKRQNALTRIIWTFIMIGGFIALLLLGHIYMILLVMLCQTLVYREVTALFSLKATSTESQDGQAPKGKDPWSKTLNWYFFAVTNYFLYGESIIYYFKHVVFADANLLPFATNHRMISFTLYIIGFMGFVMSLQKGYLKQQFGLFCWVHMSLLLIVVSSHFIVNNILEGLIWFWVPASLVICNDCFAYIWGVTVGRTPLIKLSPKKTVEGFVGAFISTVLFAVFWGTYFMRFDYMICPVHDLGVSAWSSTQCTPNPVFVWRNVVLWQPLSAILSTLSGRTVESVSYAPYQVHLLFLACFASLVAPFGGFFASGFKRAFNIKDFGHSIPGHGGMTDRMDCQFLMGIFTYVYYSSLIRVHRVTVGGILQTIVSGLTVDQQLELINDLAKYLEGQGITV